VAEVQDRGAADDRHCDHDEHDEPEGSVVGTTGAAAVVGVVALAGTTIDGAGWSSCWPGVVGTWIQAISSPPGHPWMVGR
jgi:hypothetical protein